MASPVTALATDALFFVSNLMNTTTRRPTTTRVPVTTTMAPGTGDPDFKIIVASLSTASLSMLACISVLIVFLAHIRRPNTVIRNSLNYIWAFVVFVGALNSLQTIVGRSMWYHQGAQYAADRSFCTFGASTEAGLRVLLAMSLLAFYVNMYVVRKYDEPFALRCVKWYALATFLTTAGIVTFSAITAPDSYEKHGDRCVLIVDSIQGNVPLALPLVVELAIVIVGLISAFGLLCSRSKINSGSSRRRVWIHVFFMTFLFFARLAMTVATIVYGIRENDDDDDDDNKKNTADMTFLNPYYHQQNSFPKSLSSGGGGSQVTQLADAPTAIRALLFINICFTWAIGFIVSVIFAYTECLYLVVGTWVKNCLDAAGGGFGDDNDAEYEAFLSGGARESAGEVTDSFYSRDGGNSRREGRKDEDDEDGTISHSNSSHYGNNSHLNGSSSNHNHGGVAQGGHDHRGVYMGHRGSHLSARATQSAVSLEENLQGYTLSYTIRSSSNFADGEIPNA